MTLGAILMVPALVVAPLAANPALAVLAIALVLFGFRGAFGTMQTLASEFFGGRTVGTLASVSGMAAVAGALITTWLLPVMTKTSYAPIFSLVAARVPLSLIAVLLVGERIAWVRPRGRPESQFRTMGKA